MEKKTEQIISDFSNIIKFYNIYVIGASEGKEREREAQTTIK